MLEIKPIHLVQAKDFIKRYHRHNIPPVGGKFAVACWDDDKICGGAICGRPIARHSDDGETLEIYRNCTDGTPNACTKLYGACQRIARDMGYKRIITYTLLSESGASLRAANFRWYRVERHKKKNLLHIAERDETKMALSNKTGLKSL